MSSDTRLRELEFMYKQLMQSNQLLSEKVAAMEGGRLLQSLSTVDSGDTAWVLASCALIFFMTVPGLAIFYGGQLRSKNVLATVMQCISIAFLITFLWLAFGYSIAFGPAENFDTNSAAIYGDGSRLWLQGMSINSVHQNAQSVPEAVYCMFQLTFAIITPAIICGSFADRMKFIPMMIFVCLWHVIVYCPIAHAVWHPDGFLNKAGVLDFAGGNVVEISSGVTGLVSALVLGRRKGLGIDHFESYNTLFTALGLGILWFGWFGFNAGSAFAANGRAGYAMLCSQIASAMAGFSWLIVECYFRKQPSLLGALNGALSGLVAITPGAGFVSPTGAFFIGLLAGPVCYGGVRLKEYFLHDDALDAFGIHGIGGMLGVMLVGFFASPAVYCSGAEVCGGVFYADTTTGGKQLGVQLYSIVVTVLWSGFASFVILKCLDVIFGLRVTSDEEDRGLDFSLFGESVHGHGHSHSHNLGLNNPQQLHRARVDQAGVKGDIEVMGVSSLINS